MEDHSDECRACEDYSKEKDMLWKDIKYGEQILKVFCGWGLICPLEWKRRGYVNIKEFIKNARSLRNAKYASTIADTSCENALL